MATARAGLTGRVPPINLDHRAPVPLRLVFELAHKFAPAHVGNRLGERGMGHHVLDREALDHDRLVLTDQASRKLVLMVSASIGYSGMDFSDSAPLFLAVLGALLLAGKFPLCSGQGFGVPRGVPGILEDLAVGGGHKRFQAQVNADGFVFWRKGSDLFLDQQRDAHSDRSYPDSR